MHVGRDSAQKVLKEVYPARTIVVSDIGFHVEVDVIAVIDNKS